MKAASISETSVNLCHTTRCSYSEGCRLHPRCCAGVRPGWAMRAAQCFVCLHDSPVSFHVTVASSAKRAGCDFQVLFEQQFVATGTRACCDECPPSKWDCSAPLCGWELNAVSHFIVVTYPHYRNWVIVTNLYMFLISDFLSHVLNPCYFF
jgi:hypothetical protein